MSVTVDNPNEVAKVKHILSLSQSIAEKIYGGGITDNLPVSTMNFQDNTISVTNLKAMANTEYSVELILRSARPYTIVSLKLMRPAKSDFDYCEAVL